MERVCKKHGLTNFITCSKGKGRKATVRCAKCNLADRQKLRLNKKLKLVELLGGQCKICGYNRCMRNMHFHHLEPELKEFEIGQKLQCSMKILIEEVKKCILVCANCHGEIEDGLINGLA